MRERPLRKIRTRSRSLFDGYFADHLCGARREGRSNVTVPPAANAASLRPYYSCRVQKVPLFGVSIDAVTLGEAAEVVLGWANTRAGDSSVRYVVTPNLDHVIRLREDPAFRRAYQDASLVVADGMPLVVAGRVFGEPLPERVAGSDLVPRLFDHASRDRNASPLRVYLLGAAPGVADRAAVRIEQRWPGVRIAGTHSPPLGFEDDHAENERILERIADSKPEVLLVGLGAPKQELWVWSHRSRIAANVVLCIGATIDFLAGERSRAPRWMQESGLEWLYRVGTEPRRLATRYARNALALPGLFAGEWRARR